MNGDSRTRSAKIVGVPDTIHINLPPGPLHTRRLTNGQWRQGVKATVRSMKDACIDHEERVEMAYGRNLCG